MFSKVCIAAPFKIEIGWILFIDQLHLIFIVHCLKLHFQSIKMTTFHTSFLLLLLEKLPIGAHTARKTTQNNVFDH